MYDLINKLSKQNRFVVVICAVVGGIIAIFFLLNNEKELDNYQQILPWEEEALIDEELIGENGQVEETEEVKAAATIIVDIKGEVVFPGVYTMIEGDRVNDAITKAGGFTTNAYQNSINLAERSYDEMVIYVPSIAEVEAGYEGQSLLPSANVPSSNPQSESGILLNEASSEELTTLPGIGPAKAQAIISYREEHGAFRTIDDLIQVPGIGEKTLEAIRDQLVVR